jgi:hypothetical protein
VKVGDHVEVRIFPHWDLLFRGIVLGESFQFGVEYIDVLTEEGKVVYVPPKQTKGDSLKYRIGVIT